jgi:WD40 repeat protein
VLSCGDDTIITTWDIASEAGTPQPLRVLPTESPVLSVAVTPDGRVVAGGPDGSIQFWASDATAAITPPGPRRAARDALPEGA